jgi:hypothetical protein
VNEKNTCASESGYNKYSLTSFLCGVGWHKGGKTSEELRERLAMISVSERVRQSKYGGTDT